MGIFLKDLSAFIEDPMAFVDGIKALLKLLTEGNVDVQAIIDGYVQQFQQKQEQNNPYDPTDPDEEHLHTAFEASWYEGYAAGFLAKFVISVGVGKAAKTAIKQTDTVGDIAKRLWDTGAARAISRIDSAEQAGTARATARILLAVDGNAAEALLSQADTAGQAYRLWRLQRGMDADVDALPEAKQARLGDVLSRADADSRDAIQRMDDATLADYTDLDVDPRTRASFAPRYADLDADGRDAVRELVDQTDDLDADVRDGLRAGYARGDIDVQTGDKNNIAEEVQTYSGFERVDSVDRTGSGTTVRGVVSGQDGGDIDVNGRFIRDGDAYVDTRLERNADEVEAVFRRNNADDLYEEYGTDTIRHLDETVDGDPVNIRGQLGEQVLQPDLARSKYGRGGFEFDGDSGSLDRGYIPEEDIPYDLDAGNQGFDGFAIDNDGNLVIIETKTTNSNGRVTNSGVFGDTLSDGERQMSDVWIEDRLQRLVDNADTEVRKELIRRLADEDGPDAIEISERNGEISLDDVNNENLKKELFTYQDGDQTGELAARGLSQTDIEEPTLDSVEIVKIGDVFKGI
ncbi:hypothetical protein [Natronoarchaeum rubrum]|uniref:hypothetical protein n=1 Tax=Natronoarchaeum rubrum TaxID=755311 RepID=UPI002110F6BB|nr:hypothetical protein [Natronoarchaeum rubrum]